MEILYSDIFDKCEALSAYESKQAVDSNGETMFERVHLIDQDRDLIIHYANECGSILDKLLRFVISDTQYTSTGIDFTWISDTSDYGLNASNLEDDITEIIVDYCFAQYLSNILPDRSKFWSANASAQLDVIQRKFTRSRPTLDANY